MTDDQPPADVDIVEEDAAEGEPEGSAADVFVWVAEHPVDEHDDVVRSALADDATLFHEFESVEVFFDIVTEMTIEAWAAQVGDHENDDETLFGVCERTFSAATVIGRLVPRTQVVMRPVAAVALIAMGDVDGARAALQESMRGEASTVGAWTLGVLHAAAGDYELAHGIVSEIPWARDDVLGRVLRAIRAQTDVEPGRNEPCWCGSGRKYKVCHRGQPRIPEPLRNEAIVRAAQALLAVTPFSGMRESLYSLREEVVGDQGMSESDVAFVDDVALFEGNGVGVYIDLLGAALPADHVELLRAWQDSGRRLFEVVADGGGATVRDVESGEAIDVAGVELPEGTLVAARLVDGGDGPTFAGALVVTDAAVEAVREAAGDPFDIVVVPSPPAPGDDSGPVLPDDRSDA